MHMIPGCLKRREDEQVRITRRESVVGHDCEEHKMV